MKSNILLPIIMLVTSGINAQSIGPSTINTTGGQATLGGTTFEFSIGEMAIVQTMSSSSITITHGVLQPWKQITGINNPSIINGCTLYPNPAHHVLYLSHPFASDAKVVIRIVDITGKIVLNEDNITLTNPLPIDIGTISSGNYALWINVEEGINHYESSYLISIIK